MTLKQIRDWFAERTKVIGELRAEHDKAAAADTPVEKLAEIEAAQEKRRARFFSLGDQIAAGLQELEVASLEASQGGFADRMGRLNAASEDPGPGSMRPPHQTLTRPAWYDALCRRQPVADVDREEFAQSVSDGPSGGWTVPTIVADGISRVYPVWALEAMCRHITLNGFAAISLRVVLGYAMEKAPYLASGEKAPQRDHETDRRMLEPVRQAAQCTYDRPLADTMVNFVGQLEEEAGLQFYRGTEEALLLGGDVPGPAGVFTTSEDGLPTSRDVSGNNEATRIQDEAWWDAKFHLKASARNSPKLAWVMNRAIIAKVMTMKDSSGQNIFHPVSMMKDGETDRLVGVRIIEAEDAPSTVKAGLYIACIGDWNQYAMIYWGGGMPIALDVSQVFAGEGRVGTIFERWNNGMVINSDAFARVKMFG